MKPAQRKAIAEMLRSFAEAIKRRLASPLNKRRKETAPPELRGPND